MLAKKIALGFGIAVIFPLMIHYAVASFSPEPKKSDYEIKNYYQRHQRATFEDQRRLETAKNYLDEKRCAAELIFKKHLFFTAITAGILAIIVGAFIQVEAIGMGLIFGGIFCICNGFMNYWPQLNDIWRFVSLALAFIALLIVGHKKIEKRGWRGLR